MKKKIDHAAESTLGSCPSCSAALLPPQSQPFQGRGDDMSLYYLECSQCQLPVFSVNIYQDAMATSIAFMTDLTREDVKQFWAREHIQEGDVLALHEIMQEPSTVYQLLYKLR
ncbi:MAG: hypothetical protein HYV32_04315 [Candidatus Kerfeldbacteria bacterium]|nr:hypothetical protein [Candidatus Kerfeldbacteria bacterium]